MEIREESCMGGTRRNWPILLVHELDLNFLEIWLETKFHCSSSKITEVIAMTDGYSGRRTGGQTSLTHIVFDVVHTFAQTIIPPD